MQAFTEQESESGVDEFVFRLFEWARTLPDDSVTIETFRDDWNGGWHLSIWPHNEQAMGVTIWFGTKCNTAADDPLYTLCYVRPLRAYPHYNLLPEGDHRLQALIDVLVPLSEGAAEERQWGMYRELVLPVRNEIKRMGAGWFPFAKGLYSWRGVAPRTVRRFGPWSTSKQPPREPWDGDPARGFVLVARLTH